MNEIQAYKRSISSRLAAYYPSPEAEQMARLILEEAYGISYPLLVLSDHKVSEKQRITEEQVKRLIAHEPLQYVLGCAYFHGMRLNVRKGVLIPRGETEELCLLLSDREMILQDGQSADLCTGSGAIALYLAAKGSRVEAVDVSRMALSVAEENIRVYDKMGLIELRQGDLLSECYEPLFSEYNLVVSNPPYVLASERAEMKPHVLAYEPELALFVPDSDGALFYRSILEKYHRVLKRGGSFAFEINPLLANELVELFQSTGYSVEVVADYHGRDRYLFAKKK